MYISYHSNAVLCLYKNLLKFKSTGVPQGNRPCASLPPFLIIRRGIDRVLRPACTLPPRLPSRSPRIARCKKCHRHFSQRSRPLGFDSFWCPAGESNPQPAHSECVTLSVELTGHICGEKLRVILYTIFCLKSTYRSLLSWKNFQRYLLL